MHRPSTTLLVIACLGLSACVSSSEETDTSLPSAPSTTENNTFAGLLNNVRTANGVGNVVYDTRLGVAAQIHANDMLANDFFSHTGSDGSDAGDRATRAGYNWTTIGENIGKGQATQQDVLNGWTGSPGHHANNINPAFEDFGLARAGSGADRYWVLVLGKD